MTTRGKAAWAIHMLPACSSTSQLGKAVLKHAPHCSWAGLGSGSSPCFLVVSQWCSLGPGLLKPAGFAWLFGCSYLEKRS